MRRLNLALAAMVAVGCGGAGSSVSEGGGAGTPQTSGFISVRSEGGSPSQPVIIPSRSAVITGFAGANYTSATVNLPDYRMLPSTDQVRNRRLVFCSATAPMEYNFYTGQLRNLTDDVPNWLEGTGFVHLSADGSKMVYRKYQGGYSIVVANSDGSDPVAYTSIPTSISSAVLSPNGSRVYFYQNGALKYVQSPTGSPATVATGMVGSTAVIHDITQDGTRILLTANDGGEYTSYDVQTNGTVLNAGSRMYGGAYNLAGTHYCYNLDLTGNALALRQLGSTGGVFYSDSGAFFKGVSRYPDNLTWLVSRQETNRTAFYAIDSIKGDLQEVYSVALTNTVYTARIAPYVQTRKVVGSGSTIMSGATAILYAQVGASFGSFVGVEAVDRTKSVITTADDYVPNQSLSVATVSAGAGNKLKYIYYINRLGDGRKLVSATGADGIIVTFNADTGEVVAALPFAGSKAAAKSSVIPGGRRFTGEFLGAYDRNGKNLAPGGASAVQVADDGTISVG